MRTFPTLFQKNNTGAIQQWTIGVNAASEEYIYSIRTVGIITTEFGQVGGKLQVLEDVVREGKNTGKKNATTAYEQAEKEAEAKWTKQKKKGYVESLEAARNDEVDAAVILGGVEPMLAPNKSYPKDDELAKRITFPCYAQPKLDGMRCIAVIENGKCTLWSRTRKPIPTVPHIVEDLEGRFPTGKVVLDGELYAHEYRNSFEDLISILRQDAPDAEGLHKVVEYHVYDCIEMPEFSRPITTNTPFGERIKAVIATLLSESAPEEVLKQTRRGPRVRGVYTATITSLEQLDGFYQRCVEAEYEGAMARNADAPYEAGKRSKHLQKMKPFEDREFKIVGVNEGRGKDAGTAATFTCVTPEGKEFRARLKAPYARRRELLEKPELWRDKWLTVTLKRMTQDGVPYLPVAKTIRDYE